MNTKTYFFKVVSLCFFLGLISLSLHAAIELPPLFTDNMVLQQQMNAPIWGKATPGKTVKITTSWDNKTYSVQAGTDGSWKISVKTPLAGGPYTISLSDGKEVRLNNVLIGEVWICSGQSNMEMPLAGWGKVLNYEREIAEANYPNIRLLQVKKATSNQPVGSINVTSGGWQVCSPATIAEFSSVAYFFGRNLNQNLNNVPIGLIDSSWGGTIAEAWTSGESLENMPDFKDAVATIRSFSDDEQLKSYQQKFTEWNTRIQAADRGYANGQPVWAGLNADDANWQVMDLPGFWEEKGLANFDGIAWFRKTIEIPSDWKGKELSLSLGGIDDNDITFFNGVQVGSTDGWNKDRTYKIPSKLVKGGKAIITVRVTDTGGNGGFHGDKSKMRVTGPNGKEIPVGGDWKYQATANWAQFGNPPQSPSNNPNRPTVLFNAMIRPLVPYAIRGAIWYQGESNASRAYQYRELFPLMIRDWRTQWNTNFPFYFVQLANFMETKPEPQESAWAELREAQLRTLYLENTGMAVTIDIGDSKDIHPKNKQDVGIRLALAARANTYGQKIAFSGPSYRSYQMEEGRIRISFDHTDGGLKIKDGQVLKGFSIAGSDHRFYWADAVIEGNDVIVSAPNVKFPVAVRYAWADNPVCNLYNGSGLPASPFRTDDWKQNK